MLSERVLQFMMVMTKLFSLATISVSWIWFCLLAILGRITGKIDKSGKYIVILNKVSSVIVIIVGLIILKILLEF